MEQAYSPENQSSSLERFTKRIIFSDGWKKIIADFKFDFNVQLQAIKDN